MNGRISTVWDEQRLINDALRGNDQQLKDSLDQANKKIKDLRVLVVTGYVAAWAGIFLALLT
jgi:hypothetical protein